MTRDSAKEQLVDFLDRRAFQPVLRAKESDIPKGKQDELRDLQRRTEAEIERFRNYRTASISAEISIPARHRRCSHG